MKLKLFLLLTIFLASLGSPWVKSQDIQGAPLSSVTAQDLINLINGMRTAGGLPALQVNSILMATAQDTAYTMAVNDLHWHIGDVSGRVMAAGYGGGAIAWATENFAIGPMTIDEIRAVWADADHMIPVVNANYVDIGAGVAEYNGRVWYIVQAAYTSGGTYVQPTVLPGTTAIPPVSQVIIPVQTVTPNGNGAVIHEVQPGQSLWSIAIAYNTKIAELVRLNNLSGDTPTIWAGQKLLVVPASVTSTPTMDSNGTKTEKAVTTETATPEPSTATATKKPTRIATKPPNTAIVPQISPTITPEPTKSKPDFNGAQLFKDNSIGIVLISFLSIGILLMIIGSIRKPK